MTISSSWRIFQYIIQLWRTHLVWITAGQVNRKIKRPLAWQKEPLSSVLRVWGPVFHHTPPASPPAPIPDFHRIYAKRYGPRSGHLVVKAKLHNVISSPKVTSVHISSPNSYSCRVPLHTESGLGLQLTLGNRIQQKWSYSSSRPKPLRKSGSFCSCAFGIPEVPGKRPGYPAQENM